MTQALIENFYDWDSIYSFEGRLEAALGELQKEQGDPVRVMLDVQDDAGRWPVTREDILTVLDALWDHHRERAQALSPRSHEYHGEVAVMNFAHELRERIRANNLTDKRSV